MSLKYGDGDFTGIEYDDSKARFFTGKVQLLEYDMIATRYILVKNGAIFMVSTGFHIRMVMNELKPPSKFNIVCPEELIVVERGFIPLSMIHVHTWRYFAKMFKAYYGIYPGG